MSSLRYAAQMLIKRQHLPNMVARWARGISTSAPKPNFGKHEITLPNESVGIQATQLLTESKVVSDDGSSNKSDNTSDKSGDAIANVPKTSVKDEMPAMTIVDINSGYGHMDFEERMNHMDLVDRINDAKLPKSPPPMLPLIKELPSVVNIDGFSDDMMYEDKPDKEVLPESTATTTTSNAESADANTVADSGDSLVPNSNGDLQVRDTPATQQDANGDQTMKACGVSAVTEAGDGSPLVPQNIVTSTAASIDKNICIAPVDIDAFPKEDEEKKLGTVDVDAFDDDERWQLPPIPKERNNVFEFKGIKIVMPKRMLRDETYRYRLDPNDKDKADDMHICVFEK